MRITPAAWIAAALLSALVSGCATTSQHGQRTESGTQIGTVRPPPGRSPDYSSAPVPIPITPGQGLNGPVQSAMVPPPVVLPDYPKTAEQMSGQVVVSLMKQARTAQNAGNYDQAIAKLENAQRIEPRNYFVWSALGRVYLDKKLFADAEGVALKSNSLARGNVYVELENWKVIAAARQAQGDAVGALQAQSRLDEIQRTLAGG